MNGNAKLRRTHLFKASTTIAADLKQFSSETKFKIKLNGYFHFTHTGGWCETIGSLGNGMPRLEVWLDRFSGHAERCFMACYCGSNATIAELIDQVSGSLWPVRKVGDDDISKRRNWSLATRLTGSQFGPPIHEVHSYGISYFGIFDRAIGTEDAAIARFVSRAVAFFVDVARSIPGSNASEEQVDIFPRCENRQMVRAHLRRERSSLLATECKIRDDYVCQVCEMDFTSAYGSLGKDFAEAHHIVPLSQIDDQVRTTLEDLVTVCANCHRMLHRMDGKPGDVKKLSTIVRKHG